MKTAKTAEFKAHLSEYLAAVRLGEVVIVCDRNTPIARVEPIQSSPGLRIRKATRPLSDLDEMEPGPPLTTADVLAYLRDDRDGR